MSTVLLGLGSNLGDREAHIRLGLSRLTDAGVRLLRQSSFYETAPMDLLDQPTFLNAVAEAATDLEPLEVLHVIQQVESQAGRVRTVKNGPRTLDIDILSWGNLLLDLPQLQIPHPAIHLRRFVLAPIAELLPDWRHPVTGTSVRQLLSQVSDQRVKRLPDC